MEDENRCVLTLSLEESGAPQILKTDILSKLKHLESTVPWINNVIVKAKVYFEIDHDSWYGDSEIRDKIASEIGLKSELTIYKSVSYDGEVLRKRLKQFMSDLKRPTEVPNKTRSEVAYANNVNKTQGMVSKHQNGDQEFIRSFSDISRSTSNPFRQNVVSQKSKSFSHTSNIASNLFQPISITGAQTNNVVLKDAAYKNPNMNHKSGAMIKYSSNQDQISRNFDQNRNDGTGKENYLVHSKPIQTTSTKKLSRNDKSYCDDNEPTDIDTSKTVRVLKEPVAKQTTDDRSSIGAKSFEPHSIEDIGKHKSLAHTEVDSVNQNTAHDYVHKKCIIDEGDLGIDFETDDESVYQNCTKFVGESLTQIRIDGTYESHFYTDKNTPDAKQTAEEQLQQKLVQHNISVPGVNKNNAKEDVNKNLTTDEPIPKIVVEPYANNVGPTNLADATTNIDEEKNKDRVNHVSIRSLSTPLNQDTNRLTVYKIHNDNVRTAQHMSRGNSAFGNFHYSLKSENLRRKPMSKGVYRVSAEAVPYYSKTAEERRALYHNMTKNNLSSGFYHSNSIDNLERKIHSHNISNSCSSMGSVCLFDYDADASSDSFSDLSTISKAKRHDTRGSIIPNTHINIIKSFEESDDSSLTPDLKMNKRLRINVLREGGKKHKMKEHAHSLYENFIQDEVSHYATEDFQKLEPQSLDDKCTTNSSTDGNAQISSSETRSEYDFRETHYLIHKSDSGCSNSGDSWVAKPLTNLRSHSIGTPENAVSMEDISVSIDEVDNGNMVEVTSEEDNGGLGATAKSKANPGANNMAG